MEEDIVRDYENTSDNTSNSKGEMLSLKDLKKKYPDINFNKTFIQIPGKTNFMSLSKYIKQYNKEKDSLKNLESLNLFFHGFLNGDTNRRSIKKRYQDKPLIYVAWNGFSGKRSRLASRELANLLSNELSINHDVEINTFGCSMGNVASGSFVAQMLENGSVKADKVTMLLQKIAKTHFLSSLIVRAKPDEILENISDENLKQIHITTPYSKLNIDPIHSPTAVMDFYNYISQRLYNEKLSFGEIWELQGKYQDNGVVQAIGMAIEEKQKNDMVSQENNSSNTISETEQQAKKSKDTLPMTSLPSKSNEDKLCQSNTY